MRLIATLEGDAEAKNLVWQVSGSVAVGTTARIKGVFLVMEHIAFQTDSTLNRAALTQTAVTLDATVPLSSRTLQEAADTSVPFKRSPQTAFTLMLSVLTSRALV